MKRYNEAGIPTDPAMRAAMVDALQACKGHMWNGLCASLTPHKRYEIADALQQLADAEPEHAVAVVEAQWLIESRLDGHYNMRLWLLNAAGIPDADLTAERVQPHRLAWINELIKELQS